MKKIYGPLVILALFFAATASHATIATYTEFADASGSFNGTAFTDQLVTLTFTADTAGITSPTNKASDTLAATAISASVLVNGFTSANLTGPFIVFDNKDSDSAGFTTGTLADPSTDILDTTNAAFGAYGLATSIGPDSGAPVFGQGFAFGTTGGNLVLSAIIGNATFEAVVPPAPTVPEPAEILLTTLGLLGLPALRRRC